MVICDDAADVRDMLVDGLGRRGHHVTTVEDGASAIRAILATKPDVALIDIGLPDMDGHAVAREIRRAMGEQRPRLISVTGYGQPRDHSRTLEVGFDAHIVKPASTEKILAAVGSSFSGLRVRD